MSLHLVLVTIHLLGFALGVGGATASDMTFIRATRGGKVSKDAYRIIKTLSVLVWSSVAILLLSGFAMIMLELNQAGELSRLGWSFFQLKLVAFTLLLANGIFFHYKVFPYLESTIGKSFRSKAVREKYSMFALSGAVSVVSWYTAFLMVALSGVFIEYTFTLLLTAYLLLITAGATVAYFMLNLHANDSDVSKTLKKVARSQFAQLMTFGAVGFFALLLMQLYFLYAETAVSLSLNNINTYIGVLS